MLISRGPIEPESVRMVAKSDTGSGFTPGPGTGFAASNATLSGGTEAVDGELPSRNWSTADLACYLENEGCVPQTLQVVVEARLTGSDWIEMIAMNPTEARTLLKEEFFVDSTVTAIKLVTRVLKRIRIEMAEDRGSERSPSNAGSAEEIDHEGLTKEDRVALGRASDGIPLIPKGAGGDLLKPSDNQLYGIGLRGFVARFSALLSDGLTHIYQNYDYDINKILVNATMLDHKLDQKFGALMYASADMTVKRALRKPTQREIDGIPSMLLTAASLCKASDHISGFTTDKLMEEFFAITPAKVPGDLFPAIEDLQEKHEQLCRHQDLDQGESKVFKKMLVTAVNKTISELATNKELSLICGNKLAAAHANHGAGYDPETYLAAVEAIRTGLTQLTNQ